jgi:hypothetical protein
MVATDRMLVTGMHLHFPGFTRLIRSGVGYRLISEAWEQALEKTAASEARRFSQQLVRPVNFS